MSDLKIRKAKVEDAEEIGTLHVRSWQEAYKSFMPESFLSSMSVEKRIEQWRKDLSRNDKNISTLVVLEGDKIIGFSCFGPGRESDEKTGELYAIYVHPDYYRKGAGSMLMAESLKYLSEHFEKAFLWTLKVNSATRAFYERHGWKFSGEEKSDESRGFLVEEVRYEIDFL